MKAARSEATKTTTFAMSSGCANSRVSECRFIISSIGGGTFSRRSPFASWFEDVRALGFLRPPWGLAYDALFGMSLE